MFSKLRNIDFRKFVKNNIYSSSDSNTKLSVTIALAVLSSTLPIWGFQTILAMAFAFLFRLNKIILFTVSNISQPPVTPVILFLSFLLGGAIVEGGKTDISYSAGFNPDRAGSYLFQYIIGSIVLAVILALITGTLTYLLLYRFRKQKIILASEDEGKPCT